MEQEDREREREDLANLAVLSLEEEALSLLGPFPTPLNTGTAEDSRNTIGLRSELLC